MERFKEFMNLFLFPIILILVGGALIAFRFGNQQTDLFLVGGVAVALVGLIMVLHSAGIITRTLQNILLVLLLPATLFMGFLNYDSVKSELERRQKAERMKNITIQGLKDIRKVQMAFKERYGRYTAEYDTLMNFLKADSIAFVRAMGTKPDTLTEKEALEMGLITRDTLYTPVLDSLFNPKSKRTTRKQDRTYPFIADSLPYKRGTKKKFIMDAGRIEESGGISSPVFVVKDPDPFDPNKDTLQVGSMTESETSGNWSDYD